MLSSVSSSTPKYPWHQPTLDAHQVARARSAAGEARRLENEAAFAALTARVALTAAHLATGGRLDVLL